MSGAKHKATDKVRGLLGLARKASALTIGSRETRSALRTGRVALVVVAGDGSPRDRERVGRIAGEEGVPHRVLATRDELGSWIGSGPVSVLGVTDAHLARAIRDRLSGSSPGERSKAPGRESSGGQRET